jgi:hypothetical protein
MQNKANLGQSQIVYNLNENNELQQKMQIGHLVKTNPNKANLVRRSLLVRHSFSDGGFESQLILLVRSVRVSEPSGFV